MAKPKSIAGPELLPDEPEEIDVEAELDALARRYRRAGGLGLQLLNLIGDSAEGLLNRLPDDIRARLDRVTESALNTSMRAANGSRRVIGDQPDWLNRVITASMGAAGGFGGLPSAMAELPVTTTLLLRTIQGVAREHGFDPDAESVQFDCIRIFAAAGPLKEDDGADLAFFTSRVALSGATVQTLIARVAPRFAAVLGQKLAAQTVPVLGAAAGAVTNYAYTSYYQEMAHVHFRLRKIAVIADIPQEELLEGLRRRVAKPRIKRAG
ncbi:EcsC family protein [Pseudooceanicola sp. C21-150M6]|uniref:EcsC family protein n=1 Tax=Pseudooceanicola sp. C21-150M6 TaxID=3434355 RepID=UPI003D7FEC31